MYYSLKKDLWVLMWGTALITEGLTAVPYKIYIYICYLLQDYQYSVGRNGVHVLKENNISVVA